MLAEVSALIGARQNSAELARWFNALSTLQRPEPALRGLTRGLRLVGAARLRVPGAEAVLGRLLAWGAEPVQHHADGDLHAGVHQQLQHGERRQCRRRDVESLGCRKPGDAGKAIEALAPFVKGQGLVDGKPAAYVCSNFSCKAPVTSPEELAKLLE